MADLRINRVFLGDQAALGGGDLAGMRCLLMPLPDIQHGNAPVLRRGAIGAMWVHAFETAIVMPCRLERAAPMVKSRGSGVSFRGIMLRRQARRGWAGLAEDALAA